MQFGIYGSVDLIARIGPDAPLGEYPWLRWPHGKNLKWFDGWLAKNAPGATIALHLPNNASLMAHAAATGIGVQILPCFLADRDPRLQRIAPLQPLFRLQLWLLTLPELKTTSRVRAFMEHVGPALREKRSQLAGDAP